MPLAPAQHEHQNEAFGGDHFETKTRIGNLFRHLRALIMNRLQPRPALSKGCLNPASSDTRELSGASSAFPFVCKGSGGDPHSPEWYQANVRECLAATRTRRTLSHSFALQGNMLFAL